MVALLTEDRLSLTELAQAEGVDVSTCWRWVQRGVGGIKLETFVRGGRRFTTRQAFARFCEARSKDAGCQLPKAVSRKGREAELRRDLAELDKLGI
jgi:Protein of unknown function (DUF1580)